MENKKAYTVQEAAKLLSLGKTTIYELIWQNKLKHIKIGRKIIIPETAIQEFIVANTKTNKEWKEEEWNVSIKK
ncbi:DNA binding domain protein, excisionase family [Caldicellulosiruptor hydrothermalis 108]|uniref:DNA binding domain protein, excisionase family n=1 Tax=Caldicellulosiruptor hydrothermalis (strain DSM 18901 / VKM B-2411 / 108) TaxID=632292 RepID=E4QDR4_CALH1|nr:helix-turn-helix domain-containing protein [Caldicellulosiruptor hydrothermalis]ADQ06481.1 DNA binding domain protein, excisionase family [Caldicellulosiruptor hydrothermalis 108]